MDGVADHLGHLPDPPAVGVLKLHGGFALFVEVDFERLRQDQVGAGEVVAFRPEDQRSGGGVGGAVAFGKADADVDCGRGHFVPFSRPCTRWCAGRSDCWTRRCLARIGWCRPC